MKNIFSKRVLCAILCLCLVVASLPISMMTTAATKTFTEDFSNLDKWETAVNNYRISHTPTVKTDAAITTYDSKSVVTPVISNQNRASYYLTLKESYREADRRIQSLSTTFNYVSGNGDDAGAGIAVARFNEYKGLNLQFGIKNGYLAWQWLHTYYSAGAQQSGVTVDCTSAIGYSGVSSTRKTSTKLQADSWITATLTYDYSKISNNELTVNATLTDGTNTETTRFVMSFDATGTNAYSDSFTFGLCSGTTSNSNQTVCYIDELTAVYGDNSADVAAQFEADNSEVLSFTVIKNKTDAEKVLSVITKYNALTDEVKANLTATKAKLDELKAKIKISQDNFEFAGMFNEVWESLPKNADIQTSGQLTQTPTTQSKAPEIVEDSKNASNHVYFPENRSVSRKRRVLTVKEEYLYDAQIKSFSTDVRFDSSVGWDDSTGIYLYFKDAYNWARIEFSHTEGNADSTVRVIATKGTDDTDMTVTNLLTNVNLSGFGTGEWFNVKVDYEYLTDGTNLTFTFKGDTATVKNTVKITNFNGDVKVGYGAGNSVSRKVYYDNFNLDFELSPAQFKTYFADVLSLTTSTVKEEDTELVLNAIKAYDVLSENNKTTLLAEYNLLKDLEGVLSVDLFKTEHSVVLTLDEADVTAIHSDLVLAAIADYDELGDAAKSALTSEYEQLLKVEAKAVPAAFKADNAAALALTTSIATVNDKDIVLAAIADYDSFSDNVKAKLESEIALLRELEIALLSREFEAKYASLLSLSSIVNDTDLEALLSAVEDYHEFSDNVKSGISAQMKNKLEELKVSYFGTTGVTSIDFSNETLVNNVIEILGDDPAIHTPNINVTTAALTQAAKIETVGGKVAYLPEYRGANRQRSIAVLKSAFKKPDATLDAYTVDTYFDTNNTSVDANSSVYFYYKDINNWGRLQWAFNADGVLVARTQVNNGNGTTSTTINNWKIDGVSIGEWFTLKISYKYYSTSTDVTFKIIKGETTVAEKTATYSHINKKSEFFTGIGAGYATASHVTNNTINNKVYYSNVHYKWSLKEDELDMEEVKNFLNDYSDVLAFVPSANISEANLERLKSAIEAFFALRKTSIEYLDANYSVIPKLVAVCGAIPSENVKLFRETHAEILAKTSVTKSDKTAIYAALRDYNKLTSIEKMALYNEGEKLSDWGKSLEGRDEEDFTPFYDDFENGFDKWMIDYTSSEDYIADIVTEAGNSTNSVLKIQGNVIYIKPNSADWPAMGKMVKLHLRVKMEGYTGFNPPRIFHSYKDTKNYYGGGLSPTDEKSGVQRYYNSKMMGGVVNGNFENNKEEKLDPYDWIDVEISFDDKNATIIFTDSDDVTFSVTQPYHDSGVIAFGFNDNNGITNKHASKYMYVDDVYAEFVKGDWDIDEETKEIYVYNTGNTWHNPDDIVTVSGGKLGFTVKSAKLMKLDDTADVVTDYGYLEESNFENNGKSYAIPAKNVNIDFTNATDIEFTHVAEDSFQFIIPKTMEKGIYAMELTPAYEGEETKVILINRPLISATFGNDGPSASQGGTLRIVGSNMAPTADVDDITVILKNLETGAETVLSNDRAANSIFVYEKDGKKDNYNVAVNLPDDIAKGEYAVLVHNGYGTNYAWSAPDTITIAEDIRASWPQKVFNVLDFGAIGDGNENDTGAIINALQAAADNGGGIVYLPDSGKNRWGQDTKGMYSVVDTLFIPENVVLKGDGAETSMLIWNAIKWKYEELPDSLLSATKNVEIKDISLRGTRAYNYFKTYKTNNDTTNYDFSENENIYLTNINAYFYRRNGEPTNGGQSGHANDEMSAAEIELVLMAEMKNSYSLSVTASNVQLDGYKLSTDKQLSQSACRAAYMFTEYLQVRNSHVMKGTFHGTNTYAAIIEDTKYGPDGPQFMGLAHAYVARNHYFEQTQNNHELMLNDGKWAWSGAIQFVTPKLNNEWNIGSKYVEGVTFKVPNVKKFKEDRYNGEMLIVATGQGVGQARKIVDTFTVGEDTYLVINRPFAINPNRNSQVYIEEPRERRYVVNCTFEDGGCYGTYGSDIAGLYDGNVTSGFFGHVTFNAVSACIWYISYINNTISSSNYVHGEGSGGSDGNVAGRVETTHILIYMHTDFTTGGRGFLFRGNHFTNGAYFRFTAVATRQIADIIFEDNIVEKAEYAIYSHTLNDYGYYDGLTVYNNDFDTSTYDFRSGVLNDLTNEANVNSMGYYNSMVLGENGSTSSVLKGDANLDGKVSVKDVTYIRYHLLGLVELTGQKFSNADFDENGTVTLRDALLIRDAILN